MITFNRTSKSSFYIEIKKDPSREIYLSELDDLPVKEESISDLKINIFKFFYFHSVIFYGFLAVVVTSIFISFFFLFSGDLFSLKNFLVLLGLAFLVFFALYLFIVLLSLIPLFISYRSKRKILNSGCILNAKVLSLRRVGGRSTVMTRIEYAYIFQNKRYIARKLFFTFTHRISTMFNPKLNFKEGGVISIIVDKNNPNKNEIMEFVV